MSSCRDIPFPISYRYSSDSEHVPLEFYEEAFPIAKKIDLLLGYFGTMARGVLSNFFAELIMNVGQLYIIAKHGYSKSSYENLDATTYLSNEDKVINNSEDLRYIALRFSGCEKYRKTNII